jgi:hypothetical protein
MPFQKKAEAVLGCFRFKPKGNLLIDFLAVPDGENPNPAWSVVDGINDSIVTDADPIAVTRLKLFAAWRSRRGF